MRPPRLARRLLCAAAPAGDREFLVADLDTEFDRLVAERGCPAARRWYWQQTVRSLAPLLRERLAPPSRSAAVEDARQGVRWVRRHPWTSLTIVATLTVAFGAGLAAFAVAEAAVWRPLPYPDPRALVHLWSTGPTRPPGVRAVSRPDFLDWRDAARSLAALSAYAPVTLRLAGRGDAREVDAVRVDRGFDRVIGVGAALGRLFADADFTPGGRHVVVLQHGFWRREFGADRTIVGRTINLDETAYEIVGVLPPSRTPLPLDRHDLWIPLVPREGVFWETSRSTGWLTVVGRLGPPTSRTAAEAELTAIAGNLARDYPASNRDKITGRVEPMADEIAGPIAPVLALLGAAIGAVLLIACGNIASLRLASLAARNREFAVRAAIGAGRLRLVRQVFAENLVLCALGAAAGLLLAPSIAALFIALYPGSLTGTGDLRATSATAIAAAFAAIASAALLTIPQAASARHPRAPGTQSSRHTASRSDRLLRSALVTVQIALSFVLLVASVALGRTMQRLTSLDPGFRSDGVLTFTLSPSRQKFPTAARTLDFYDSVIAAARTVPGVHAAAAGLGVPLTSSGFRFGLRAPGSTVDVLVTVNHVTPDYFATLGIAVREGRLLTDAEQRGARVVVVNAPLARALAGEGSPLGMRVPYSGESWEVVGVVAGTRQRSLREPPAPELFLPWRLAGARPLSVAVRTEGAPLGVLPALAARIHELDPSIPLGRVAPLSTRLAEARQAELFRGALVAALALVAVALAALGAYSVTAYAVARRTREYGVRMALGERPASIAARALWTAAAPALQGILIGAAVALAGSRWLESFLFEVQARDITTFAAAGFALMLLAVAAAGRSAFRASRADAVTNCLRMDT